MSCDIAVERVGGAGVGGAGEGVGGAGEGVEGEGGGRGGRRRK